MGCGVNEAAGAYVPCSLPASEDPGGPGDLPQRADVPGGRTSGWPGCCRLVTGHASARGPDVGSGASRYPRSLRIRSVRSVVPSRDSAGHNATRETVDPAAGRPSGPRGLMGTAARNSWSPSRWTSRGCQRDAQLRRVDGEPPRRRRSRPAGGRGGLAVPSERDASGRALVRLPQARPGRFRVSAVQPSRSK